MGENAPGVRAASFARGKPASKTWACPHRVPSISDVYRISCAKRALRRAFHCMAIPGNSRNTMRGHARAPLRAIVTDRGNMQAIQTLAGEQGANCDARILSPLHHVCFQWLSLAVRRTCARQVRLGQAVRARDLALRGASRALRVEPVAPVQWDTSLRSRGGARQPDAGRNLGDDGSLASARHVRAIASPKFIGTLRPPAVGAHLQQNPRPHDDDLLLTMMSGLPQPARHCRHMATHLMARRLARFHVFFGQLYRCEMCQGE